MHFRTEKAYVRGLAGGAFRGRLVRGSKREVNGGPFFAAPCVWGFKKYFEFVLSHWAVASKV